LGENTHGSNFRFDFRERNRMIIAIVLALSIVVNITLLLMYRYDAQERDLDRYDDGQRQEKIDKELADIRSELKVDQALIQAYGLQKAVKEK
jgi:hypothetical protein